MMDDFDPFSYAFESAVMGATWKVSVRYGQNSRPAYRDLLYTLVDRVDGWQPTLFVSQGGNGIDSRRAARGDVACQESYYA